MARTCSGRQDELLDILGVAPISIVISDRSTDQRQLIARNYFDQWMIMQQPIILFDSSNISRIILVLTTVSSRQPPVPMRKMPVDHIQGETRKKKISKFPSSQNSPSLQRLHRGWGHVERS
jgi:hypothetical protein